MGLAKLILICLCIPVCIVAQNDTSSYTMVELNYMKARVGMESAFENAVEKHNDMFHAEEGDNEADLFMIMTGDRAGWYVWTTNSTFTEMDEDPFGEDHEKDWNENVAPKIESYGAIEYWRLNDKLSNSDDDESPMIAVWVLNVEEGEFYRFRNFLKQVKEVHEELDEEIAVYFNQFGDGSKDAAIVFSMEGWSDFDDDSWKMEEEFDKLHGEGSWDDALEEWQDVVKDNNREIWKRVN